MSENKKYDAFKDLGIRKILMTNNGWYQQDLSTTVNKHIQKRIESDFYITVNFDSYNQPKFGSFFNYKKREIKVILYSSIEQRALLVKEFCFYSRDILMVFHLRKIFNRFEKEKFEELNKSHKGFMMIREKQEYDNIMKNAPKSLIRNSNIDDILNET